MTIPCAGFNDYYHFCEGWRTNCSFWLLWPGKGVFHSHNLNYYIYLLLFFFVFVTQDATNKDPSTAFVKIDLSQLTPPVRHLRATRKIEILLENQLKVVIKKNITCLWKYFSFRCSVSNARVLDFGSVSSRATCVSGSTLFNFDQITLERFFF